MGTWADACRTSELPSAGEGRTFKVNGLDIAIFRLDDGSLRAIDDECPHAYGSLGEGMLIEHIVVCPLHGWSFDVRNGQPDRGSHVPIRAYPIREENEVVQVLFDAVEVEGK